MFYPAVSRCVEDQLCIC